jgi:hypothetical protein
MDVNLDKWAVEMLLWRERRKTNELREWAKAIAFEGDGPKTPHPGLVLKYLSFLIG